ncbi:MAG: hypothetical protein KAH20_13925 [Methylococcales bacterium]|nr:hypothetical protein [Methylococcales bacterium]
MKMICDKESEMKQVISTYSEEMRKNISDGEWDVLNNQLERRQKFLEDFFLEFAFISDSSFMKEMIYKIQLEDIEFQELIKAQKQMMKKQLKSLKQGKKAVKVYQEL